MKKIYVLSLALIMLFCCGPKQQNVDRILEEGVEVVINHIEPYKVKGELSTFQLEEELKIDTQQNDIAEIGLTDISNFEVDSNGNIYFLNSRSNENFIYKFDKDGKFITSFGRRGQGPGEIQGSMHLEVNNEGQILVTDQLQKKIIFFKDDGSFVIEESLKLYFMKVNLLKNGNYLVWHREMAPPTNDYLFQTPISLCNSKFKEIKKLDRYKLANFRVSGKRKGTEPLFTWDVSNDIIYIGNEERDYEIWVFDLNGYLIKKIRKEYKKVSIPNDYKEEKTKFLPEQLKNITYFPNSFPPFQGIFCDDVGRLFVMTYEQEERSGEYIFDIFNKDGIFIGRQKINTIYQDGLVMSKIKQGRLYCISEKENGFKELVVHKMNWE